MDERNFANKNENKPATQYPNETIQSLALNACPKPKL
jgi:hypothetical protein